MHVVTLLHHNPVCLMDECTHDLSGRRAISVHDSKSHAFSLDETGDWFRNRRPDLFGSDHSDGTENM